MPILPKNPDGAEKFRPCFFDLEALEAWFPDLESEAVSAWALEFYSYEAQLRRNKLLVGESIFIDSFMAKAFSTARGFYRFESTLDDLMKLGEYFAQLIESSDWGKLENIAAVLKSRAEPRIDHGDSRLFMLDCFFYFFSLHVLPTKKELKEFVLMRFSVPTTTFSHHLRFLGLKGLPEGKSGRPKKRR